MVVGLFSSLFGKRKAVSVASSPELFAATTEILDYSITTLRIGIFKRLYNFYSQTYADEAKYLCGAILNSALVEEPANNVAKRYMNENRDLVLREVAKLYSHPTKIEKTLSYLYSAQILYLNLSVLSGNRLAGSKIIELSKRASELRIMLPDTYEICGRGDAYSCAEALALYAKGIASAS